MLIVKFTRRLVFGEWDHRGFDRQDDRQMPVNLYRMVPLPFAPFPGLEVNDNGGLWLAAVDHVHVFVEDGGQRVVCTCETHEVAMHDPVVANSEARSLEIVKNRVGAMVRAGWHIED